ncbi:hypothetical protein [Ornithobacterium rhinotracheale]|uniref:hypothetical protein n=1 Tax=Ornithobacterium rhinotracheale TaxID=28251 RepID=UPI00403666B9
MKKSIFLLFLLYFVGSFGQKCSFKGQLLDSINYPVYDASITAFDSKNKSLGFVFSDENGNFEFALPCEKIKFEINHISFSKRVETIDVKTENFKKIILTNEVVSLKDVIAKGRIPVQIKGDTIEYDAQSFQTGNEEVLEDILKKLPGVSIENGVAYYQGKPIKSIKVEGREVFGNNAKLISKNLPSDAVEKIQLSQKLKMNPFASSLQEEDQPELNIVLKEDKKSLVFGNLSIGGDAHKHTDLQENLFYFSRKVDGTLISDYNTFGKQVFSNQDYRELSGVTDYLRREGGLFSLRSSNSNAIAIDRNSPDMRSANTALNLGYQKNSKLYISGFVMANKSNVRYAESYRKMYQDFTQIDENKKEHDLLALLSRFTLNYSPKDDWQVKYQANFNAKKSENFTDNTSFVAENGSLKAFRKVNDGNDDQNFNQKLSVIKKMGEHNLGIYVLHLYNNETPTLAIKSNENPFYNIWNLSKGAEGYGFEKQARNKSNVLSGLAVYNHLLTPVSNLRVTAGLNYNKQKLDNEFNSYQTPILNRVLKAADFSFSEIYADANYSRKIKNLNLNFGATLSAYHSENKQPKSTQSLKGTEVLPHASANLTAGYYTFKASYLQSYSLPSLAEFSEGLDVVNFNTLYEGNPLLNVAKNQRITAFVGYNNLFKFVDVYFQLSYLRKLDNIRNQVEANTLNQILSPFNANTPEHNCAANLGFSKRFSRKYQLKLKANWQKSDFDTRSNGKSFAVDNTSQYYQLNNLLKWNNLFELNFGSSFGVSNYQTGSRENKFKTLSPFANMAFILGEKWLVESNYAYNEQWRNDDFLNHYHSLSASVRFRPAAKVFVKFSANNLLDNNLIVSEGFTDTYTYIYRKEVLGKYFILQVKYKF